MTKQETSVVWKTVNRLWTCHYFRMNNGYFNRGNEAWRVKRKLQEKQRWERRSDRGIVGHTQSLNRGGPCFRPPSCLIMTPINSFATFSSVWFVWSFIHFGLSHCFLLGCQHLKKKLYGYVSIVQLGTFVFSSICVWWVVTTTVLMIMLVTTMMMVRDADWKGDINLAIFLLDGNKLCNFFFGNCY